MTLIILSALCLANIGVAFADGDTEPIPVPAVCEEPAVPTLYNESPIPTLYNEEAPVPVLYNENTPMLISEKETPVLISEKPEFRWNSEGNSGVMETYPILENNSMYFPLRELAEAMGFSVEWNASNRSVDLTKNNFVSNLYIDNTDFSVNGSFKKLSSNPLVVEGRTYLSETDIENMLGLFITLDDTDLFLNTSDIEILDGTEKIIENWLGKSKETPGTHIKTVDGISYILIVEEEKNTGGYTFDFSNIEIDGGILRVEYSVNPPTDMATQALTKPYALLKVSSEISEVKVDHYNYTGTITDLKFGEGGATLYLEGGNLEERIDDLVVRVGMDIIIEGGTANDFKIGTILDIQYSFSTRSIPAQTNAEKIRVIETPEIFSTYTGIVKEVSENDKGFSILLSKDENYMNDLIVHIKKGSYMESEMYELDGKAVTVEYTICTMSLPPQTSPIKIQVNR
jgi:hypothetical protein